MPFDHIRYARNVSDDSTLVVEMSEMPEKYVVVSDVMYFADSSGFVMMYPVSGDWSEMPDAHDVSDWSDIPASPEDGRKWAVNAKYYDESNYGVNVPDEVTHGIRTVVIALSVLHDFGVFNYEIQ